MAENYVDTEPPPLDSASSDEQYDDECKPLPFEIGEHEHNATEPMERSMNNMPKRNAEAFVQQKKGGNDTALDSGATEHCAQ